MRELIERASATGAQFEIYSRSAETRSVVIENSEFKNAEANFSAGVSLRLIKGGRAGASFTTNLTDPGLLVENALAALGAGVGAEFSFPRTGGLTALRTYSEKAEPVSLDELLAESLRIRTALAERSAAQINVSAKLSLCDYRLVNSAGTDVAWKESLVEKSASLFTAGGSDYLAADIGFDLAPMRAGDMDRVCEAFAAGAAEVRPPSGKRNVLFMPRAMEVLLWRVRNGASAQSLHQKVSPLAARTGEQVFSGLLTLRNDPLNDTLPGARAVDDEGVPCSDFALVEKGIFRGFYSDLRFASKTGLKATGHGYRRSVSGGDPLMLPVLPFLSHLRFDKGEKSFEDLLREMQSGLVVFGSLGSHTGNIANGDFSIGLSPGLCVEKGRIVGRARDTMVSGNIYDVLKRAVAVGGESDPAYGNNPPILLEGVDVSN